MGCQFVTARLDHSNQMRVLVRNPAEHKESRPGAIFIEHVQNAHHIHRQAALTLIPTRAGNDIMKCFDLEVLFHINCQDIFHRSLSLLGSVVVSVVSVIVVVRQYSLHVVKHDANDVRL